METAEGDSAETGLSKYAKLEGVVEFDRRPNQLHQGIPVLAPVGNLRRILLLDGFLGWLPDREGLSTEEIPTDLTESSASIKRLRFLLFPGRKALLSLINPRLIHCRELLFRDLDK